MNKAILVGRLGQDPELKHMPNGNAVVNFSIATSESWVDKKSGKKQEKTEWHRVVFFGPKAEVVLKHFSKGSNILVEGKIATRTWDDNNGVKRYSTEVIGSSFEFIGSKVESSGDQNNEGYNDNNIKPEIQSEFASDLMPF